MDSLCIWQVQVLCIVLGAARFVKSRYSRYSSVSDMLDVLGWTPLSQRRQEARLILFYKIINGLAQVPFEGVLVEAYKGTRRKHNMKFRQIGHTTQRFVCSELGKGATSEAGKYRFRAASVWWRCAQYFVIGPCG